MTTGRKPTPTALKVLRGNPGKRPLNRDEPAAELHSGKCPRWLPAGAPREVWRRLAPRLVRSRVLTVLDEESLAAACCQVADFYQARSSVDPRLVQALAKALLDSTDRREAEGLLRRLLGLVEAQAKAATAAGRAAQAALAEHGLTPSARSRVKVQAPPEVDELDLLLGGKSS